MKHQSFRLDGDHFIQRVVLDDALVDGVAMHEHSPEQNHTAHVISGSVRIYDGNGWDVVVMAGETVDLADHPRHEIKATASGTVIENTYRAAAFPDDYVRLMTSQETITAESCLVEQER